MALRRKDAVNVENLLFCKRGTEIIDRLSVLQVKGKFNDSQGPHFGFTAVHSSKERKNTFGKTELLLPLLQRHKSFQNEFCFLFGVMLISCFF